MYEKIFDLTGKVALVTGGSKGLGKAMARVYAEHGANIMICSRNAAELASAAAEIGAFYVNAALLFDVRAGRVGVSGTLEVARRINSEGPDAALRAAGLNAGGFDADVLEALRSR